MVIIVFFIIMIIVVYLRVDVLVNILVLKILRFYVGRYIKNN